MQSPADSLTLPGAGEPISDSIDFPSSVYPGKPNRFFDDLHELPKEKLRAVGARIFDLLLGGEGQGAYEWNAKPPARTAGDGSDP